MRQLLSDALDAAGAVHAFGVLDTSRFLDAVDAHRFLCVAGTAPVRGVQHDPTMVLPHLWGMASQAHR